MAEGTKAVDAEVINFSLNLYQPMMPYTGVCIMSSHKPIRIYMGGLMLGVNTLYRLFCFFKLFPMVGKGLTLYQPYKRVKEVATTNTLSAYGRSEYTMHTICVIGW